MDFEGALRARLLAASPVTTLVSDYTPQGGATRKAIFVEDRPQGSEIPDILLQTIVDSREQHMGGFQALQSALVQVDVRGRTAPEKKALKEAVIAALAPAHSANGINFRRAAGIVARPGNERTITQFIFRDMIDFTFFYSVQ